MANEPVPQPYPAPQVEVHLARDVGRPISQERSRAANDTILEAEWSELRDGGKSRPSAVQRFLAWRGENTAKLPGFWAEMAAIGREAIKDIRQTLMEVMLNNHEHAAEPGTPLNPTQIMTTDDLRPDTYGHGYDHDLSMYAARGGNEQDRGISR